MLMQKRHEDRATRVARRRGVRLCAGSKPEIPAAG
jgi:hypothetical protein